MPRKKKGTSKTKILLVIVVIAVVTVGVVAWHDGLIGITRVQDINNGTVSVGSSVAVKGEIIIIFGNLITISDDGNIVAFSWSGPSTLNSIVVVRGVVGSFVTLTDVTSVEVVWIFN